MTSSEARSPETPDKLIGRIHEGQKKASKFFLQEPSKSVDLSLLGDRDSIEATVYKAVANICLGVKKPAKIDLRPLIRFLRDSELSPSISNNLELLEILLKSDEVESLCDALLDLYAAFSSEEIEEPLSLILDFALHALTRFDRELQDGLQLLCKSVIAERLKTSALIKELRENLTEKTLAEDAQRRIAAALRNDVDNFSSQVELLRTELLSANEEIGNQRALTRQSSINLKSSLSKSTNVMETMIKDLLQDVQEGDIQVIRQSLQELLLKTEEISARVKRKS